MSNAKILRILESEEGSKIGGFRENWVKFRVTKCQFLVVPQCENYQGYSDFGNIPIGNFR